MSADSAKPGAERSHYSYEHYASAEVAAGFDALRFGGPIGQELLAAQQAILLGALAPIGGKQILDVGTGTGRAALALAEAGADVVGVDASAEMLAVARRRALDQHVSVRFDQADAHHLPFADRSMDAVVCFRLLMHLPGWRQCVAEFCRISRHRVVIDFPARLSVAALESGLRRLRARFGSRVEAYRVLAEADVRTALVAGGFRVIAVHRQYVLPINVHKKIGSLAFTRGVERSLAAVGLLRLFGSPVTMVAER